MKKIELKEGQRFGKFLVVKEGEKLILPSGQKNRTIVCKCDCGNIKSIRLIHLIRLRITSCGCSYVLKGESGTLLCKVWKSMIRRCTESAYEKHLYFGKGIKVCDEWINDYFAFKDWALKNGYKKGLQIDRQDNSKGYQPNNCRWVTSEVNCNNRDNTFFVKYRGLEEPFMPLLRKLGKSEVNHTIRRRIDRGWNHEKAIDTPSKEGNYKRKITRN